MIFFFWNSDFLQSNRRLRVCPRLALSHVKPRAFCLNTRLLNSSIILTVIITSSYNVKWILRILNLLSTLNLNSLQLNSKLTCCAGIMICPPCITPPACTIIGPCCPGAATMGPWVVVVSVTCVIWRPYWSTLVVTERESGWTGGLLFLLFFILFKNWWD